MLDDSSGKVAGGSVVDAESYIGIVGVVVFASMQHRVAFATATAAMSIHLQLARVDCVGPFWRAKLGVTKGLDTRVDRRIHTITAR